MGSEFEQIANRVLAQIPAATTGPKKENSNAEWFKTLEKSGIYKRYWDCNFTEIEKRGIPKQIKKQYPEIKEYADNLSDYIEKGVGLILKGPVGTMKTTLAVAILQKRLQNGSGLFIPMASMLDNLFTMKARSMDEWLEYERKLRETGLLVLDDLGVEYHQEWVLSKVDAIITERYNRMKPIIITTNLCSEELHGKYAERIIDRLRSTSKEITFSGDSLREAV